MKVVRFTRELTITQCEVWDVPMDDDFDSDNFDQEELDGYIPGEGYLVSADVIDVIDTGDWEVPS